MLTVLNQLPEVRLILWKRVVVKAPQSVEQLVSHCGSNPTGLLHERRIRRIQIDTTDVSTPRKQLEVLAYGRDVTLLLQHLGYSTSRTLIGQ